MTPAAQQGNWAGPSRLVPAAARVPAGRSTSTSRCSVLVLVLVDEDVVVRCCWWSPWAVVRRRLW